MVGISTTEALVGGGNLPRLLLLSYPRTASNLLVRVLALKDQLDVEPSERYGYHFTVAFDAMRENNCLNRPPGQWTKEEQAQVEEAFQKSFDDLEADAERAKSHGKIAFVKEHCSWTSHPSTRGGIIDEAVAFEPWKVQVPESYGVSMPQSRKNVTVFPDEYLRTWTPTFLIRHPALAFPSYYRAMGRLEAANFAEPGERYVHFKGNLTLKWQRMVYEWYCEPGNCFGPNNQPVILDADDILTKPEIVVQYCKMVGLDQTKLKFAWDSKPVEEGKEKTRVDIMLDTLYSSPGLLQDKAAIGLDVDAEAIKWKHEFGEEVASQIEEVVRAAMPDYEFLKDRRLRVKTI